MKDKTVNQRVKEIKSKLESLMKLTFCKCKSSNREEASFACELNTLAYECSKEMDKLESQYKKDIGDTLYKPVNKNELF